MQVELSSVGNPDYGQDPTKSLWGCEPNKRVKVSSFKEASKLCREFIEYNNLGGGNWSGGDIFNDVGARIAYVSYNGRVWELGRHGERMGKEIEI